LARWPTGRHLVGKITLKEFDMKYCNTCNTPLRVGQDSCPRHPVAEKPAVTKSVPKAKTVRTGWVKKS
jgi:hypothetical protein